MHLRKLMLALLQMLDFFLFHQVLLAF